MNLPPEELSFFFWAGAQLSPDVRPVFVARVAAVLGAHRDPGPGDFDRAIRDGILGLWTPPAIEEVRGVSRWHRSAASFEKVSKAARPVEEKRRRRPVAGHGYIPA
jgi:hypothetical protein